jgi:hypothetical protein
VRTVRSTRRVVNPTQLDQEGPGRVTPLAVLAEPAVVEDTVADRLHLRMTFETLISRLFQDSFQFCSGLVDLVVMPMSPWQR